MHDIDQPTYTLPAPKPCWFHRLVRWILCWTGGHLVETRMEYPTAEIHVPGEDPQSCQMRIEIVCCRLCGQVFNVIPHGVVANPPNTEAEHRAP